MPPGLASDIWQSGIGRVGGLLTLSYQDRSYREDSATNSTLVTDSTAIAGRTITYTNGVYNTMFVGDRRRTGADAVLQWQPADDFLTYAEASSEDFDWAQNQYTFTSSGNAAGGSALTADVFYKHLTSFILQETEQNAFTLNGITYNLTGAIDGPGATIKGIELGYQQFYRKLPGPLSGLGTPINYTYISAAAPTSVVGVTTTVPGLSRISYDVIGRTRGPHSSPASRSGASGGRRRSRTWWCTWPRRPIRPGRST